MLCPADRALPSAAKADSLRAGTQAPPGPASVHIGDSAEGGQIFGITVIAGLLVGHDADHMRPAHRRRGHGLLGASERLLGRATRHWCAGLHRPAGTSDIRLVDDTLFGSHTRSPGSEYSADPRPRIGSGDHSMRRLDNGAPSAGLVSPPRDGSKTLLQLDFGHSGCIASEIDQSVKFGWEDFGGVEDLPRPR